MKLDYQVLAVFPLLASLTILMLIFLSTGVHTLSISFGLSSIPMDHIKKNLTNNKIVMITFGDISESQFINAKPILDKYGFKASFFVTCNWVRDNNKNFLTGSNSRMTWEQIQQLYKEGHDVESKTMTHPDLNKITSGSELEYEIGNSKKCLLDHGISNVTIFAPPHGNVHNSTIIKIISKYYDFADNGFGDLMFLHCNNNNNNNNNKNQSNYSLDINFSSQKDCRTFNDNGSLTNTNRYSIKEWSHNYFDSKLNHNDTAIYTEFVKVVNSQQKYNNNNTILAIPIIAYHKIDDSKDSSSTDIVLFEAEMKYLYDNGFKVVKMSQLGFDKKNNVFYIK